MGKYTMMEVRKRERESTEEGGEFTERC